MLTVFIAFLLSSDLKAQAQTLVSGMADTPWQGYPQGAVEDVLAGSTPATFANGMIVDGFYHPDTNLYLVWETADLSIDFSYAVRSDYPARLETEDMLTIAEAWNKDLTRQVSINL